MDKTDLFFLIAILVVVCGFFIAFGIFIYQSTTASTGEVFLKTVAVEHCSNNGMVLYNYNDNYCQEDFVCIDGGRQKHYFYFSDEEIDNCNKK